MEVSNEIVTAYLAGYFDGEGSVCVARSLVATKKRGKRPYHSLRIQVPSTSPVAIEEFKREFGGYIQFQRKDSPKYPPRNPVYVWCACSRVAAAALELMLPFLRVKRADAEVGLAFQRLMVDGKNGKPVTDAMAEERDQFRLKLIQGHGIASRSSALLASPDAGRKAKEA